MSYSESVSDYGGLDSSEGYSNQNQSFSSSKAYSELRGSLGPNSVNNSITPSQSGVFEKSRTTNVDGNIVPSNWKNGPNYLYNTDAYDTNEYEYFDNIGNQEQEEDLEENRDLLNLIEEKYRGFGFNKKDFRNEFKPNQMFKPSNLDRKQTGVKKLFGTQIIMLVISWFLEMATMLSNDYQIHLVLYNQQWLIIFLPYLQQSGGEALSLYLIKDVRYLQYQVKYSIRWFWILCVWAPALFLGQIYYKYFDQDWIDKLNQPMPHFDGGYKQLWLTVAMRCSYWGVLCTAFVIRAYIDSKIYYMLLYNSMLFQNSENFQTIKVEVWTNVEDPTNPEVNEIGVEFEQTYFGLDSEEQGKKLNNSLNPIELPQEFDLSLYPGMKYEKQDAVLELDKKAKIIHDTYNKGRCCGAKYSTNLKEAYDKEELPEYYYWLLNRMNHCIIKFKVKGNVDHSAHAHARVDEKQNKKDPSSAVIQKEVNFDQMLMCDNRKKWNSYYGLSYVRDDTVIFTKGNEDLTKIEEYPQYEEELQKLKNSIRWSKEDAIVSEKIDKNFEQPAKLKRENFSPASFFTGETQKNSLGVEKRIPAVNSNDSNIMMSTKYEKINKKLKPIMEHKNWQELPEKDKNEYLKNPENWSKAFRNEINQTKFEEIYTHQKKKFVEEDKKIINEKTSECTRNKVEVYQMTDAIKFKKKYEERPATFITKEDKNKSDKKAIKDGKRGSEEVESECGYKRGQFFRFRIDLSMIDTQIQHDKINDSKNPYIYIDIEVVEDRTTLSYFSWAMNLANKLCFNIFYLFENKEYEKMDKILGVNNVQHFALTFVYYQQYSYIYHQHSIMKWIWTLGTFIYMSYVSQIKNRLGYTAALYMMIYFYVFVALGAGVFYFTQWQPMGQYISQWSVDSNAFNWINAHVGFSSADS